MDLGIEQRAVKQTIGMFCLSNPTSIDGCGWLALMEKKVELSFWPAHISRRAWAAKALAVVMGATPAAAQTGAETTAPPASSPSSSPKIPSPSEVLTHFVASAIPTANFIATASRLAISKSRNSKLQKLAETLAKDQTDVARSLNAWVNVKGPVVTPRSPISGKIEPGAKISAPNLLPAQVSNLQRLSASQGKDFDLLFVSTQMEALLQLQTLYRDFLLNGTDPGLRAIATRQSPKVEQAISSFDKL